MSKNYTSYASNSVNNEHAGYNGSSVHHNNSDDDASSGHRSSATGQRRRHVFLKRKKLSPFGGKVQPTIDYKDLRFLRRFVTDYGQIMPARVTLTPKSKQREIDKAIKRARFLGLMPFRGE